MGSIGAALVVIAGIAAAFDIPLPQPAWKSDVAETLRYAQAVDRLATQEALEAVQLRLYRNLAEQDSWRQQGKRVPDYLLKEQAALESKRRGLENRLLTLQ